MELTCVAPTVMVMIVKIWLHSHIPHWTVKIMPSSRARSGVLGNQTISRTAAHIFVSPGDAPALITQYVAWMEREFNACQTPRSMYLSIFNSFRVIRCLSRCASPKIAIFTYRSRHFCFPWRRPCDYHAMCCMDGKTIQCLPNPLQHLPIYLQLFPSYTMLKSMRKSKNLYFYHILVSPGDAPGAITLRARFTNGDQTAVQLIQIKSDLQFDQLFWSDLRWWNKNWWIKSVDLGLWSRSS